MAVLYRFESKKFVEFIVGFYSTNADNLNSYQE